MREDISWFNLYMNLEQEDWLIEGIKRKWLAEPLKKLIRNHISRAEQKDHIRIFMPGILHGQMTGW